MESSCTYVPRKVGFLSYPLYIKLDIEPCSEKGVLLINSDDRQIPK
jgi:hypothetical protein